MDDKLYKVKDIMEMFGVSRDTIKYYEKRGLITPSREENGYRLFDALNVEKMKRALDLRDLGYTFEDVIEISESCDFAKGVAIIKRIRKEAESEIRELGKKIDKIRAYERCMFENQRFENDFNIEYDVTMCVDCPKFKDSDRRSYFVRQGEIFYLNDNYQMETIEQHCIVINSLDYKEECRGCGDKMHFKHLYRGSFPYESDDNICQLLANTYSEVEKLGHKLKHEVYVTKRILVTEEGEKIFADIRIPIDEKNKD